MVAIRTTMTQEKFDQFLFTLKYPPNRFQLKVLHSIAFGSGNIIVDAKAGSGKTSLLKMIASLLKFMGIDPGDVLFQAFNKSIEKELNKELPQGFTARTSHSLGFEMCREWAAANRVKLGRLSKKKYYELTDEIAQKLHPDFEEVEQRRKASKNAGDLIDFIMANDVVPEDTDAIENLAFHYGIDVTPAMIGEMPRAIKEIIKAFKERGEMHYIDMVYMPVALNMQPTKRFKYVLVDECQDLNTLQQEISAKMLHPEGRIILVGDIRQSIYGFSGADANSFNNLKTRFNAETLELNICYRCPTSHIEIAQSLVPSIEAAPNAIEGTIEYKHLDMIPLLDKGSMLICRLNAPLVSAYFQFIAMNKPAAIVGRSIGKGLTTIVDKIADMQGFYYGQFGAYLKRYKAEESARLAKKVNSANRIAELEDRIKCLDLCFNNFVCTDIETFKEKLTALFIDTDSADYDPKAVVTLSSVHRAKGLESDVIGIIYQRAKPVDLKVDYQDIMPLSWSGQRAWEREQELNIKYVALTRAKKSMIVFGGWGPGKTPDLTDHGGSDVDFDEFDIEEDMEENLETSIDQNRQPTSIETESQPELEEVVSTADVPDVVVEPVVVDLDTLKSRLALGIEALELTIEHLTSSQTAEGEEKERNLSLALIHATEYSEWLNKQNFTLEQCALLVGDKHKFTLKNQHVKGIVETAVGETKSQDTAIELALSMTRKLLAVFQPEEAEAVAVVESPVNESEPPITDAKKWYDPDDAQAEVAAELGIRPIPTKPVEWAKWVLENRHDVVILDLETTDKQDKKNPFKKIEIVQIAVIDMDGNPLINTLIKPIFVDIHPEAAAIHKKTLDVLAAAGATSFADNWSAIEATIKDKHIIIYNRAFDQPVLVNCAKLHGLKMPQVKGWHCAMLHYVAHNDNKITDWGKRGAWWRLTEALEQERITPDAFAHDALVDVQMTRQLVEKMATNDPNKWRNSIGFDIDEMVVVKDSGVQMQVVKTLDTGELLLKGVDDPNVSLTMRASLVERFNGKSPLSEEAPVEPENQPRKRFVILGRIFDIDPVEYDTEGDVANYLREIEGDETATPLRDFLVQEWTPALTFKEQTVIDSWYADVWFNERAPIVEIPSIEDKNTADTEPVTVEEPNVPDKAIDPFERIKDIITRMCIEDLSISQIQELHDITGDILSEKEAEEAEPVTQ